jgi:molecular chaperone GrpE
VKQQHRQDQPEIETPAALSDSPEVCASEVEQLTEALADKDRQLTEHISRLQRLQADFDNYRRRSQKEKEELSRIVVSGVVKQLLPVIDNLERALAAAPAEDAGQLLTGVQLVYRQFVQILENLGISPIVAVGAQFDPALHEAILRLEDAGQPDGLIVEELQKGYTFDAKVLRPSMVKVVSNV